jgi:hypothetical protein
MFRNHFKLKHSITESLPKKSPPNLQTSANLNEVRVSGTVDFFQWFFGTTKADKVWNSSQLSALEYQDALLTG